MAFRPSDLSGLGIWLDASQLALADGAAVSAWTDMSGAGNHFTPVSTGSPVFKTNALGGKPVVRFSAQDQTLRTPANVTVGHIFVVAHYRSTTFSTYNGLLTGDGGNDIFLIGNGPGTTSFYHHPVATYVYRLDGVVYPPSWPASMGAVARSMSLSRDPAALCPVRMGMDRGEVDRFWDGDVAEIVVYNRVLSDAERQSVEGYLNSKWFAPPAITASATLGGAGSLVASGVVKTPVRASAALTGSGTLAAVPRRVHDVIIPKLPLVQLVCSPSVICGSGHLCGEIATGDRYYEWALEFDGGRAVQFNQRNVTIPEPFSGDAVCGKVICGVPPTLCGQNIRGDHYYEFTLDLDGANVTLTLDNILRPDDQVLELDGARVRVNPVLMPDECFDLELAEILCTPLDLTVTPPFELVLTPASATVLTAPPTSPEDA